mmetsp:Transcript_40577/g.90194  ORF Transcript_40577/g.90194 Transcript_40577/m.90194 type:complete len:220 (-) Transcript_40577:238-897(-)
MALVLCISTSCTLTLLKLILPKSYQRNSYSLSALQVFMQHWTEPWTLLTDCIDKPSAIHARSPLLLPAHIYVLTHVTSVPRKPLFPPRQNLHAVQCARIKYWVKASTVHLHLGCIKQGLGVAVHGVCDGFLVHLNCLVVSLHVINQLQPCSCLWVGSVNNERPWVYNKVEATGVDVGNMYNLVLAVSSESHVMPWNSPAVCDDPWLIPVCVLHMILCLS